MIPEYRTNTIKQITAALPQDLAAEAVFIERSCYNAAIFANRESSESCLLYSAEFISRYDVITTRVILHLSRGSTHSESLISRIRSGEVSSRNIGEMTPEMLNPAANSAAREEVAIRLAQKIKLKTSTAYRCKKCQNNCTTYEEYQSRSGDEPSCISHKCMICGHSWRT